MADNQPIIESTPAIPPCGRNLNVLTREEAAGYLSLRKVSTVDWLRENGYIVGRTVGREILFDRSDLDAAWEKLCGRGGPSQSKGKSEQRAALKLAGGNR